MPRAAPLARARAQACAPRSFRGAATSASSRGARAAPSSRRADVAAVARRRRASFATRATSDDAEVADEEPANWKYAYLYDGACPVCQTLKSALEGTGRGEG